MIQSHDKKKKYTIYMQFWGYNAEEKKYFQDVYHHLLFT
jgi:hypothetical protein